nr:hypothetical protein [Tanacetum cinerariifolium]
MFKPNNDVDDSDNRLELKSHKENPEYVNDNDDKAEEKNMERKYVTTNEFWKVHKKVDQVLQETVPQLVEKATDDLIENNLKPCLAETKIKDRDAFRSKVLDLISQEFKSHVPKIIEDLFENYV